MPYSRSWLERQKLGLTRSTYRSVTGDDSSEYKLIASFSHSKTGEAVPGFRNRIEKGLDASSYYSVDKFDFVKSSPVTWKVSFHHHLDPSNKHREVLVGWPYPVTGDFDHLVSPTAAVDAEARSRLYSRLRSERTSVNGFNVLGELRETIKMIRKPASALLEQVSLKIRNDELTVKRIKGLPRSKRREQWSKALSGSLLEINFGWKPLMSDIMAIAEAGLRFAYRPPLRKQFSAVSDVSSSAEELQDVREFNSIVQSVLSAGQTRRTVHTRAGFRYVAGVLLQEQSAVNALDRLRILSGFTAENILPTAWELTPWSFLVDYFSNIGDVIEAATTDTSNVFYCTKTTFQETVVRQSCQIHCLLDPGQWAVYDLSGPAFESEIVRRTLIRSVMGKPPLPQLTFTHPGESLQKLGNMLSLLDQKRPSIRF